MPPTLFLAALLAAHRWDQPPTRDGSEDWRLVSFIPGRGAMFYDAAYTVRVGEAATFETLVVFPKTDPKWGDQRHEHYLVDCRRMKVRRTDLQYFDSAHSEGESLPPVVVTNLTGYDGEVPAVTSPLARAARFACQMEPAPAEVIKDPVKWWLERSSNRVR